MQPRFPPRGTPEYFQFLEEWFLKERVDNERQWRAIREVEANVTGLDPILNIVSLGFSGSGSGSGSGGASGSGSRSSCACGSGTSTRTVVLSGWTGDCAAFNGTHVCSNVSSSSDCEWIGTTIRVVFDPGSGNWTVYGPGGCRLTNWNGTCAGFSATAKNS